MPFNGSTIGVTVDLSEMEVPATKGGIVVGDGAGAPVELTVGANNTLLTADSAEASGTKWASQTDENFVIAFEVFS